MVPHWVAESIIYQIFPDRFYKSNISKNTNLEGWDVKPSRMGFKGGDLNGICEKLDYLMDLGVNTLYLNPIFTSPANHRYHTYDYFQVDPLLGGNSAFKRLIEQTHERGMKILIDGVFNHASRGFFPFHHVMENGLSSPYLDWFHFNMKKLEGSDPLPAYSSYDRQATDGCEGFEEYGYKCWWGLPALPKLNTDNPEVRNFIFEVAKYWIDQGADGWRLDVPEEIDDPVFWGEFRQVVKSANAEAYIVE